MKFTDWIDPIYCPLEDDSALYLYLVKGNNLMLIDTGISSTPQKYVLPYIIERGWNIHDLASVVITHGHVDHFGGNAALYKMNPAITFHIHCNDREWAEDRHKHFNQLYQGLPGIWEPSSMYRNEVLRQCGKDTPVNGELVDQDCVSNGELSFTCLHMPGHSPGHIILHHSQMRAAICGDAIQQTGTVPEGIMVFPLYDDVDVYLNTLQQIEALHLEIAATAHFGVLQGEQIKEALEISRMFVHRHNEYILDVLQRGNTPLSTKEMTLLLHKCHYSNYELGFQIYATTWAHCQHLRKQNLIEKCLHNGQMKWQLRNP